MSKATVEIQGKETVSTAVQQVTRSLKDVKQNIQEMTGPLKQMGDIMKSSFIATGVREFYRELAQCEAAFNKLHPEMAAMAGSAVKFGEAMTEVKAGLGGLISMSLSPLRDSMITYFINPMIDGLNWAVKLKQGILDVGTATTWAGITKQISDIEEQVASFQRNIDKYKGASPYRAGSGEIQYANEQIALLNNALNQLLYKRGQMAFPGSIVAPVVPNVSGGSTGSLTAPFAGEIGGMTAPSRTTFPTAMSMAEPAIEPLSQYIEMMGTADDMAVQFGDNMVRSFKAARTEAMKMDDIMADLTTGLREMVAKEIVSGLWNIGEALGSGGDAQAAFANTIQSILANLPTMLLGAGLQALIVNPLNPLGWALLAGAGVAAIIGGAVSGYIESQQVAAADLKDATATTSGGGISYGSSTTVQTPPDIKIYMTFQGPVVGDGGGRQIGEWVVQAISDYLGTGARVQWLEN